MMAEDKSGTLATSGNVRALWKTLWGGVRSGR